MFAEESMHEERIEVNSSEWIE